MKRLLLLRHAKAAQDSNRGDHARALAPRGRRDAPAMGDAMHANGLIPDRVLCSTAVRTMETWELLAPKLKTAPPVELRDGLYLASWNTILKSVRETDDTAATLMVIGHNPGIGECAVALSRAPQSDDERARRGAMSAKFPTGALAVLEFDAGAWRALRPGTATLSAFLTPRNL